MMDLKKISSKGIKDAGVNLIRIGNSIICLVILITIHLILVLTTPPNYAFYTLLLMCSYAVIVYFIIKNVISAGRNLKNCEVEDELRIQNIKGDPIPLENFEIAQSDFNFEKKSIRLNWDTANELCDQLNTDSKDSIYYALSKAAGTQWRLPTKEELDTIYKNKDKIGGLSTWIYWSSSECDPNKSIWIQDFEEGKQSLSSKYHTFYARAVRSISKN